MGMIAIATTERNGKVVGACLVDENDEIILWSERGKLVRTPVSDIRVCSRAAQGVTLINLKDDLLVSVTTVKGDIGSGDEAGEAGQAPAESWQDTENPA